MSGPGCVLLAVIGPVEIHVAPAFLEDRSTSIPAPPGGAAAGRPFNRSSAPSWRAGRGIDDPPPSTCACSYFPTNGEDALQTGRERRSGCGPSRSCGGSAGRNDRAGHKVEDLGRDLAVGRYPAPPAQMRIVAAFRRQPVRHHRPDRAAADDDGNRIPSPDAFLILGGMLGARACRPLVLFAGYGRGTPTRSHPRSQG